MEEKNDIYHKRELCILLVLVLYVSICIVSVHYDIMILFSVGLFIIICFSWFIFFIRDAICKPKKDFKEANKNFVLRYYSETYQKNGISMIEHNDFNVYSKRINNNNNNNNNMLKIVWMYKTKTYSIHKPIIIITFYNTSGNVFSTDRILPEVYNKKFSNIFDGRFISLKSDVYTIDIVNHYYV